MVLAWPSLSWFGVSPIGLYRSVDQPSILLTLVGLWYTGRGFLHREAGEPEDERGGGR